MYFNFVHNRLSYIFFFILCCCYLLDQSVCNEQKRVFTTANKKSATDKPQVLGKNFETLKINSSFGISSSQMSNKNHFQEMMIKITIGICVAAVVAFRIICCWCHYTKLFSDCTKMCRVNYPMENRVLLV